VDEADQLGDRIAIMAKGDVKCCGSSLFLKSRYGVGYTLTITKGEGFDEAAVSSLLDASIPGVTPLSNIAAEISFRLPFQSSAHFADVFDQFDGQQARLGITGYGISVTTLEEVFLAVRVGHEDDADPAAVLELEQCKGQCSIWAAHGRFANRSGREQQEWRPETDKTNEMGVECFFLYSLMMRQ